MKVALATIAAALTAAAVSAAATASSTTTHAGRLYGTVTRGPISPICRAGVPCSAPAAGAVLVFTRGGVVVARVTARHDGSYRVRLARGRYSVRTSARGTDPGSVMVRAGVRKRVDFSIDTGIR